MTTKFSISLFIFFFIILNSCGQKNKDQKQQVLEPINFNTDSLLYHVKVLSSDAFEGRRTGTDGAKKAKDYIINQYKNFNIQPLLEEYQQHFAFDAKGKTYEGTNILGYVKGSLRSEDYIVISAHYDHEGIKNNEIYNGADDDASGVSALFALAEYFKKYPPKHSVIFAAFDAEELGLQGSNYFVENSIVELKHIKLNINLDMIGRNDNNELYATGTAYNDTLKSLITNFKTQEGITLLMGHDGKDGLQDWTFASDHGPFHQKKIPFLYFGEENHKDYHKPTDDFENIQPRFYQKAVETVISIFKLVDDLNL